MGGLTMDTKGGMQMKKAEIEKRLVVAETMFIKLFRHFKLEDSRNLIKVGYYDFGMEMFDYKSIISPTSRCSEWGRAMLSKNPTVAKKVTKHLTGDCKDCKKFFNMKNKEIMKEED